MTDTLDAFFAPQSLAVIGASDRAGSIGAVLMRNLLEAGYPGPIYPVNPNHNTVAQLFCYPNVKSLPGAVDLAVICSPAATVPQLIVDLAETNTRGALVISAGFHDHRLQSPALSKARAAGMRILGPNCVGLLVPGVNLNASFAHLSALPGKLAFVSQSGAFCTAVLDWAKPRDIGFSAFVSLGDSVDVDVADVLTYLGDDAGTNAILVYLESVTDGARFFAAAKRTACKKPVILLKAGRFAAGARAAASHTGALAGADAVYDAAVARAGMLRVFEIEELFEAAETLERAHHLHGERLAVLTNGGGPGVTAADSLVSMAGEASLAELSAGTRRQLSELLPRTAALANPVDIIGDAPAERLCRALEVLLSAPEVDSVLVLYAPTAITSSTAAAEAVARTLAARSEDFSVLTAWLGEATAEPARKILRDAGIPSFDTPYSAVRAFWHLAQYRRNQQLADQSPDFDGLPPADRAAARQLLDSACEEGRVLLNEPESKRLLAAYGIPVVETRIAQSPQDARRIAESMGFPVALKILSPDVTHKTDVGGVALDLGDADAVVRAAGEMTARLNQLRPGARLDGFTVQSMARRPGCIETLVGATTDPVFGPVVMFGEGGTDVELIHDRAIGLPPLNRRLAAEMIAATRVSRRFVPSRGRPGIDRPALEIALVRLSQLLMDLPDVQEMDINPLLVDPHGVIALDARIRLADKGVSRTPAAAAP